MGTGKILTLDSYILTCIFVKFYMRTQPDELTWKSLRNKKKRKKKSKQCDAEAEKELSREVAGEGCRFSVHTALELLGSHLTRGASVTGGACAQVVHGVLCFMTRKLRRGGLCSHSLRQDSCSTPWVRELHVGEPEFVPSFLLTLAICSFLLYVPEVLGQHWYCGKFFWCSCSSEEGMDGNLVISFTR